MCPPFGSDGTIMAYEMPLGGGIHRISSGFKQALVRLTGQPREKLDPPQLFQRLPHILAGPRASGHLGVDTIMIRT
jgi:hypothetical protein